MEISETKLDGVLLITPPTIFEDVRGMYVEIYNEELYAEAGITVKFVEDDISVSSRHVLRGVHGDQETWKLISCLHGKFYLAVVNWDKTSPQFGQWASGVERPGYFSLQAICLLQPCRAVHHPVE